MSSTGILQIPELRTSVRPYLQIISTVLLGFGVLGGWAGDKWLSVLIIFTLMISSVIWIGRAANRDGVRPIHVFSSAIINLTTVSIIVLLTGGAQSPFWLLFLIGAITGAMSCYGRVSLYMEWLSVGVTALVMLVPVLIFPPLNFQLIALVSMKVLSVFGSSMLIRKVTTLMMESRDELAANEEQYRLLIDGARDLIMMSGLDGNVMSLNPAFESYTGRLRDEWLGHPFIEFFNEKDRQRSMDLFKLIIAKPSTRSIQLGVLTDTEEVLEFLFNASPLMKNGEVVGVMGIGRILSNEEQNVMERERLTRDLVVLDQVRNVLVREMGLTSLIHSVVDALADIAGYELVSFYLKHENMLVLQHQIGYDNVIKTISIDTGVSGRVIRGGEPIYLEDVRNDPDFLGAIDNITSEICVPLFDEDVVVGMVNVESHGGMKLTENDLKLMLSIAEHVNIAITRARLIDELQRNNSIFSALQESMVPLMKQLELSEALQAILVQASKLLDTTNGYIYIVEPGGETLEVILGLGVFSKYLGNKLKMGEGLAGKVWETGQPLKVDDYYEWTGRSAQFKDTDFRAVVGVPLFSGENIVGVLGMSHLEQGRVFSDDDVELIGRFAQLASVAFENARLYTQAQQELADRRSADEALRISEERYRSIFRTSGVSIWEEDYSSIKNAIDELRGNGVTDFRMYFRNNPDFVQKALGLLKIVDVNEMTLKLYGATTKDEFLNSMDTIFGPEFLGSFIEEMIVLAEGGNYFEGEVMEHNLQGELLHLWRTIVFPEDDTRLGRVLVSLTDITARKQAEENYRNLVEQMPVVLYRDEADEDATNFYISPQMERLLGYPPSVFLNNPKFWHEKLYPEDYDIAVGSIRDTLEKDYAVSEYRMITSDDRVVWVRDTSVPIKDDQGNIRYIQGFLEDITSRKQVEDDLRQREADLLKARAIARLGSYSWNMLSGEIKWSDELKDIWGLEGNENYEFLVSHLHPDDHARVVEAGRLAREEDIPFDVEYRILRDDGSIRYVIDRAEVRRDSMGNPIEMFGTVLDVSAIRQAEESVLQSEKRLKLILESALDAIITMDPDGYVIDWNPQAEMMFGWSQEEAVGNKLADLIIPEDIRSAHYRGLKKYMETGEGPLLSRRIEIHGMKRSGELFPLELSITPVPTEKRMTFTGFLRDISERKQAERLQQVVYRIAQSVVTTNSLDELFPQIHEALTGILTADNFYIALYDRKSETLTFPYFVDQTDETPEPQKLGHGLTEYVIRTKIPLFVTRAEFTEMQERGDVDLLGADSYEWLGVPLVFKEEVLGVMVIQIYNEGIHFHKSDRDVMSYVSTQVANAIQRKRSEDELRAAETRYRTLVEQIPAVIYTAGPHQFLGDTYISPQIEQFGFTQEEWLADENLWITQVHTEDRSRVLYELEKMKDGGRPFRSEYRMFTRDGRVIWMHDEAHQVLDEKGNPILIQGFMLDITSSKAAQEQIKRQLEQLQALRIIDMTISASTDLRLSLQTILKQAVAQLKIDAADILLLNPASRMLEHREGVGFRTNAVERTSQRSNEGLAGRVIYERKTVTINDLTDPKIEFARRQLLKDEEFVMYWGIPLIVKGEVKGVMEVFHRSRLDPGPGWIDFFESLASQAALAIENANLFNDLRRSNFELIRAYESTIEGWSAALDMRDKETEGHTKRVTDLTMELAAVMGIPDKEQMHIRRGALLHDIGKMGVPDRILFKPDKLTDDEWKVMQQHPVNAKNLLTPIEYLRYSVDIPYCHHERWDGKGYPRGLKGTEIPLSARIFSVVDVFDALTSDRPYRSAWDKDKTLDHIKDLSGTHFDPMVVDAFLGLIENR